MYKTNINMKIITNEDLKQTIALKKVFENKSLVNYGEIENVYETKMIGEDEICIKVKTSIENGKNRVFKHYYYFPDYRETNCFNLISDNEGFIYSEFLFNLREKNKTYFNIVLFDNENNIVSSDCIVFDKKGNNKVLNYDNMISDLKLKKSWIEESRTIDCLTNKESYQLKFCTEFDNIDEEVEVLHFWQNMTQTIMKTITLTPNNNIAVSILNESDSCFAKDFWQIICMDVKHNFVAQGGILIN